MPTASSSSNSSSLGASGLTGGVPGVLASLKEAYESGNYMLVVKVGSWAAGQAPFLEMENHAHPHPPIVDILELVGDAMYATGDYDDARLLYDRCRGMNTHNGHWFAYKACLSSVLSHHNNTTGGYHQRELHQIVASIAQVREEHVGPVHYVTVLALRRAVLGYNYREANDNDDNNNNNSSNSSIQEVIDVSSLSKGLACYWAEDCLGIQPNPSPSSWYGKASSTSIDTVSVKRHDLLSYSILASSQSSEALTAKLHVMAQDVMRRSPSSNVAYTCMSVWLKSQMVDGNYYPFYNCLGADWTYASPLCPEGALRCAGK